MGIIEEKPITMAEVTKLAGDKESSEGIKNFIKDFEVIDYEKAIKLKEELLALDLIKLKESHIVKIVDFLPKDAFELNKVITDVSLDSEETQKILDVTKNY